MDIMYAAVDSRNVRSLSLSLSLTLALALRDLVRETKGMKRTLLKLLLRGMKSDITPDLSVDYQLLCDIGSMACCLDNK